MERSDWIPRQAELAWYATPHEGRMGRMYPEEGDGGGRTTFQRDKARIRDTKAFRRLSGKTQVFVHGEGDHFRTRGTHTGEVDQVSRDLGRQLGLNEDLIEAIALGHDIGHPPFGHPGEDALNEWMQDRGGSFEHNVQGYRRLTLLEKKEDTFRGINLNREVLHGILKHSKKDPETGGNIVHVPEAQLVNVGDGLAYIAHDPIDAFERELFRLEDMLDVPLAREAHERIGKRGKQIRGPLLDILGEDVLRTSRPLLCAYAEGTRAVRLSERMQAQYNELLRFLFERMYRNPLVNERREQGKKTVRSLCDAYERKPCENIIDIQRKTHCSLPQAIADYVSGMTDHFAMRMAAQIA